jgi:hypothetical protein
MQKSLEEVVLEEKHQNQYQIFLIVEGIKY